jgi:hypothetical protein
MRSIKITLTPSEAQDFRWFLEKCIELVPTVKRDIVALYYTKSNWEIVELPLTVVADLSYKLMPKLYFIKSQGKNLKVTLKRSECLAIQCIINHQPLYYLSPNEVLSVQTIWLLQVGKYL